jgi:hypothetical protein
LFGTPDLVSRFFNNKIVHLFSLFTQNYFQYFSPRFLFSSGPGEYTYGMVPGRGVLYLFEVVFILGFLAWMFSRDWHRDYWFIVWMLAAPSAAALAIGPGYAANRAAIAMPAVQIASSIGAVYLFNRVKWKKLCVGGFVAVWFVSFVFFLEDYFVQQSVYGAKAMSFGAGEIFNYADANGEKYDYVIVSKSVSEPQIFAAFYGAIDPIVYREAAEKWEFWESGLSWIDQLPEYRLGKYVFKRVDWKLDSQLGSALIIGTVEDFPADIKVKKRVVYPNKEDAYLIVDTNAQF